MDQRTIRRKPGEAWRILHVLPDLDYGGISLMLLNFYRHIDRNRFQFDFLHYGGGVAPIDSEIMGLGGRIFRIQNLGSAGLFGYFRALRSVMLKDGPFDAVHIHTNYMAGFIALAARTCGIRKRICHMRGVFVRNRKIKYALPFLRLLIRWNATKLLAVSEATGRFFYGNMPYTVLKNAVDTKLYASVAMATAEKIWSELGIASGMIVIGHVARFTEEKNHKFLLEVAKRLEESGTVFKFFFAGDGPLLEPTRALFGQAGLENRAVFLGNRGDVPVLMHVFGVTVLPSFSEGLPNVVMQSQAAGTPCVLSDTLTREVDIGLGLLAYHPLSSAQAWADAILRAAVSPRPKMEAIADAFVLSGFDIDTAVKELERIYEDG
jgi:glycosyltransferase EpsF